MSMDFWRQLDIVSRDDLTVPITIIGAGGVGSPICFALAKMGCQKITVFDHDVIADHNLPNQFYRLTDSGKPKVHALKEIVKEFSGLAIEIKQEKYVSQKLSDIVICSVDSMSERRKIWEKIRWKPQIFLFIDARMGAEVCRIYTVKPTDPDDVRFYEGNLYSDSETADIVCTAQAVIYNVFMIASLIASQVKKFARIEKFPKEIIFDLATLSIVVRW